MDQFVGGIRPGEDAQVQQAKVVQRVQSSLERLAALGQVAHTVLPPSLHEVRPLRAICALLVSAVWTALNADPACIFVSAHACTCHRLVCTPDLCLTRSWWWRRAIGRQREPTQLLQHSFMKLLVPASM